MKPPMVKQVGNFLKGYKELCLKHNLVIDYFMGKSDCFLDTSFGVTELASGEKGIDGHIRRLKEEIFDGNPHKFNKKV